MLNRFALIAGFASLAAATSCSAKDVPIGGTEGDYVLVGDMLPEEVVDVDLLFVIDDSGSMAEEQASLTAWAEDALFGVLELDPGTPLNLHIAVVSTDLGVGSWPISSCDGSDNGVFNNQPGDATCSPPTDRYIIDVDNGDGGRITNYSGTLSETFSCIARLGVSGCGYEQPLETMRRALDGSNPENAGFLRDEALLAVIIVSDEDDCSVFDTNLFDTSQTEIDDPLGPLTSFRCFEFGVECEGDDPRTPGAKSDCGVREDSAYLDSVEAYADFLKSLKDDPSMVVVGAIVGDPEPVEVEIGENGNPQLSTVCSTSLGMAYPAVRTRAFLDQFPARNRFASICTDDLQGPLNQTAMRITDTATRSPCLQGVVRDVDESAEGVQAVCHVAEVAGTSRSDLESCDDTGGALPCFRIVRDDASCAHTETQLAVQVDRDNAPTGHTVVECLSPE